MKYQPYDTSTSVVTVSKQFSLAQLVNSFTIKNIGTTYLFVNNDPLLPGEFKAFEGNEGEIYKGRLDLKFGSIAPGETMALNMGVVTQKFYVAGGRYDNPRA